MFETEEFETGENSLSKEEELLCKAYQAHGRDDLAECVKTGRIYQRLHDIVKDGGWSELPNDRLIGVLNGLTSAMSGVALKSLPSTVPQWQADTSERYSEDPDLIAVIELDARRKVFRNPDGPTYHLEAIGQTTSPLVSSSQPVLAPVTVA